MRKRLLTLTLVLIYCLEAASAQNEYSFSATAPTGQTLYYYIIDSAQVAIGPPNINSLYSYINSEIDLLFGEFSTPIGWNGFSAPSGNLTIPATVTYNDTTYTVRGIEMAFMFCDSLTSVTFPNTPFQIGSYSFFGCKRLTSIFISDSVTNIGSFSFGRCGGLTSISVSEGNPVYDSRDNCNAIIETSSNSILLGCRSTVIPNTVTTISQLAFFMCDSLSSITIPNSITYIGDAAFAGCSDLTSISVSSGNPWYDSRNNCNAIIQTASNNLIVGCQSTTIPRSVNSIGNYAFMNCHGLTSIIIPDSVSTIMPWAFWGCNNIDTITLLCSNPPFLGGNAFENVPSDIPVIIPCGSMPAYLYGNNQWSNIFSNIQEASGCASYNNAYFDFWSISSSSDTLYYKINEDSSSVMVVHPLAHNYNTDNSYWLGYTQPSGAVIVPSTVTNEGAIYNVVGIWESTFQDNTNITSVTLPYSITTIGTNAFANCSGMVSVNIPNSITSISAGTFCRCSSLNSISIPNACTSIGDSAFAYCTGFTSVAIPDNVIRIGGKAFKGCSNLQTITIGRSVSSIGYYAFYDCSRLSNVTILCEYPPYINDAFNYTHNTLTVPCRSRWSYENDWLLSNHFRNIVDDGYCNYYDFWDVSTGEDWLYDTLYYKITSSNTVSVVHPNEYEEYDTNDYSYSYWAYYTKPTGSLIIPEYVVHNGTTYYVTAIEDYAFRDCDISYLDIGRIRTIGTGAFEGNYSLSSVSMSPTIDTILYGAFPYTYDGLDIYFDVTFSSYDGLTEWCNIYFEDYWNDGFFNLYMCDNESTGCIQIHNLVIPTTIDTIPNWAFYGCVLDSITLLDTNPPIISYNTFDEWSYAPIIVPCGSTLTYSTAWDWLSSQIIENPECSNDTIIDVPTYYDFWAISSNSDTLYYKFTDSTHVRIVHPLEFDTINNSYWYGFTQPSDTLVIPSNVIYENVSYIVSSVENSAFKGCSNINSIAIPNTIDSIGTMAFAECGNSENNVSVLFEGILNKWCSIDFGQYWCNSFDLYLCDNISVGCVPIRNLTIPTDIDTITDWAFYGCTFDSIFLLDSVPPVITLHTFDEETNTPIIVPCGAIPNYDSLWSWLSSNIVEHYNCPTYYDFWAIAPSGDTLYYKITDIDRVTVVHPLESDNHGRTFWYGHTRPVDTLEIPSTVAHDGSSYIVSSIENSAFRGCNNIVKLIIPNTIDTIGTLAFAGCSDLSVVNYNSDSCHIMPPQVFAGCNNFTTLTIGNNVKIIPDSAFYGCASISDLTIGDSVVYIGNCAFLDCQSITTLTIPRMVRYIGDNAFFNTTSLTTLYYNADSCVNAGWHPVEDYMYYPFGGHDSLFTNVYIGENVKRIPHVLFANCIYLHTIIIPDSVVSIGQYAFRNCFNLDIIHLGSSVSTIEDYAFIYCSGLDTIVSSSNNPPSIGNYAFYDVPMSTTVLVPCSNLELYNTSSWNMFTNIIGYGCIQLLPELHVTSLSCSNITAGQSFSVSWTVTNNGTAATPVGNSWTDRLYLSSLPYINSSDASVELLGSWPNVSALDTGQSYTRNVTLSMPLRHGTGQYYLFLLTDALNANNIQWPNNTTPSSYNPPPFFSATDYNRNNTIIEINEMDTYDPTHGSTIYQHDNFNMNVVQVTLPPLADLEVSNIIHPNNFYSGNQVNVTATITNTGNALTLSNGWRDALYISSSPSFDSSALQIASVQHSATTPLAPNSSYQVTFTGTVPLSLFGEAYFYVTTNVDNNEYEHVGNNNNTSRSDLVNIFLTPPADLVISSANVPSTANNQTPLALTYTVTNLGMGQPDFNNWYDHIYLSTAPNLSDTNGWDTLLGSIYHSGPLSPCQSYTIQRNFAIPDNIQTSQNLYVIIITDANSNIFEYTNENNNTYVSESVAVTIYRPDFALANLQLPDTVVTGHNPGMSFTLHNLGRKDYIGNLPFAVYYSSDSIFNITTAHWVTNTNPYISALAESQHDVPLTLSFPNSIPDSDYYVFVVVNPSGSVSEVSQLNNILRGGPYYICHRPLPDLVLLNVNIPDTLYAGQTATISFDIVNNGETTDYRNANIYNTSCHSRLRAGNSWCPVKLQTSPHPAGAITLAVGDTLHYIQTVSIPPTINGNTSFTLSIDASAHIQELNENNNTIILTRHVVPTSFDLAILNIDAPDSCTTGDTLTLSWTVGLSGLSDAAASTLQVLSDATGYTNTIDWTSDSAALSWLDRLSLSANPVNDGETLSDASIHFSALTDSSYTVSRRVVIPHTMSGTLFLIATTDNNLNCVEQTRANNTFTRPLVATPAPQPNLHVTTLVVDDTVRQRQGCMVHYTVINNGNADIVNTAWRDSMSCGNIGLTSKLQYRSLAAGESYTDSIYLTIPENLLGNKTLMLLTDAKNTIYERDGESDNSFLHPIHILPALPCDLIVTDVSSGTSAAVGSPFNVNWTVQNIGTNAVIGYVKDGIYLSTDTIFDNNDVLVGEYTYNCTLQPFASLQRAAAPTLQGVTSGDYYVIVRTNIMRAFYEMSYTNNQNHTTTTTEVSLPALIIGQSEQLTMASTDQVFYRMEVGQEYVGQTLSLTLTTEAANAFNSLYLSYEAMPTASRSDYGASVPYSVQQQILVPSLQQGSYYIFAEASTTNRSPQDITLLADIVDFEILHVNSAVGSNTGSVTTQVVGAKFDTIMDFRLTDANGYTPAQKVKFSTSTDNFVTFNLTDLPAGTYNVEAELPGGIVTIKENAFVVEQGLPAELAVNIVAPSSVRLGNTSSVNIEYGNNGTTDLNVSGFLVVSENGHPIGLSSSDLAYGNDTLTFSTAELGMDPDIIRPGYFATKTIYVKASSQSTISLQVYILRKVYE